MQQGSSSIIDLGECTKVKNASAERYVTAVAHATPRRRTIVIIVL